MISVGEVQRSSQMLFVWAGGQGMDNQRLGWEEWSDLLRVKEKARGVYRLDWIAFTLYVRLAQKP